MKPDFVKIAELENALAANWAADVMEKNNIPYLIREYRDTAYDGLFIGQLGWGTISVPAREADRAQMLLTQVL